MADPTEVVEKRDTLACSDATANFRWVRASPKKTLQFHRFFLPENSRHGTIKPEEMNRRSPVEALVKSFLKSYRSHCDPVIKQINRTKTMKKQTRDRGFTLIELMVVITIIAVLASFAMPAFTRMQESAKITKDTSNIRQIILACKSFATDNEGSYPSWKIDDEGGGGEDSDLGTSTEAFNVLISEGYIDTESIFWYKTTNPEKQRPPRENGELESDEVTYTYVKGQLDTTFSRSPLIADEQDSPGSYGEYHPWLNSKKAVVGYCGGNVAAERLDSREPGAIVKTRDGLEVFAEKSGGEDSESKGLLAVSQDNVLNP